MKFSFLNQIVIYFNQNYNPKPTGAQTTARVNSEKNAVDFISQSIFLQIYSQHVIMFTMKWEP